MVQMRVLSSADVVKILGAPDEILSKAERMKSRRWACNTCSEIVESDEPIQVPAPCKRCGGIAFKTG
jgi:hypothetical protein